ncbi:MAG: metal-dependent hydrolase [Bacillaceae bacterium]|nr:metal-dependent hydrolase [Bacillaceae bacterium]
MDTGTHIAMGFGLAGLAYLDPAVQSDPTLAIAVMAGTVVGSNAPDFDGFLRFKGNASYIKNHRGMSHSLPFILIWGVVITALIVMFFPGVSWGHLFFWTQLAVLLHVLIDLFNAYGTQMLRPFSEKWISFNIINIFDPFIFVIHFAGFLIWAIGFHPGITFAGIYFILILYLIQRTLSHQQVKEEVRKAAGIEGNYTITPTMSWSQWGVIVETPDSWHVGDWKNGKLEWHDRFQKLPESEIIRKSKQDPKVAAFLYFTRYAHVQVKKRDFGYEVKWFDLRYRMRSHYGFVAVVCLDEQFERLNSYTGWVYRPQTIEKKLEVENIS